LVIGDGPARSELKKILPDAIFAGHLAGESLGRAVASADILINPSISESFGNVTLEAMASKLAIICANVPASRFLIQDRYSGLLCKMSRTDEATYALKTLVESPEMRARLSENAYRQAQKHSWHRAMANVSDAYQMLMNQRSTIGF
jgi:phosphatidylinositol alpha 1,6-mannosyltransferase